MNATTTATLSPVSLPHELVPLTDYPDYAIHPNGDVWRITPILRGRCAGEAPRKLVPVIHPRGHSWAVFLKDWDGRRKRVAVKHLLAKTFGAGGAP
jgi:hypothetical protein